MSEVELFKQVLEICRREALSIDIWYGPVCNEAIISVKGPAVHSQKGPEDFHTKSKAGLDSALEYMKEKLEEYYGK